MNNDTNDFDKFSLRHEKLLDHGHVILLDHMGCDKDIADAARMSYGKGTRKISEDRHLLRYLLRHHHCYHGDMEVLTSTGWKKWKDCNTTEFFAVPNPDNKTISYEKLHTKIFDFDGQMYGFKNSRMSYLVTEGHSMYFKNKYLENYKKVKVEEMLKWGHFCSTLDYNLERRERNLNSKYQLIGFYLGDGRKYSTNKIIFHLKKERKLNYLKSLLKSLEIEYRIKHNENRNTYNIIFDIPSFMLNIIDFNSKVKKINYDDDTINQILNNSNSIFDGLINSDGHVSKTRPQYRFSSTSPYLLNLIESVAYNIGYITKKNKNSVTIYNNETRTSLESRKQNHYNQYYNGKVYCTTTSTGWLVVRGGENSIGFICGNTSPFEMAELKFEIQCPIFVARQWIRHRTACLSGDTLIQFDLPSGKTNGSKFRAYNMSVDEIYRKFQPTRNKRKDKQKNPYYKRDKVKNMMLRSVDEITGEVYHTNIVDIWQSGEKEIFKIKTSNGKEIKTSKDHLFFTNNGWKKLIDINKESDKIICVSPKKIQNNYYFPNIDDDEIWTPLYKWEEYYQISSYGRIKRTKKGKACNTNKIKIPSISQNAPVVSVSKNGKTETINIHRSVLLSFNIFPESSEQTLVRHLNGNILDNRISNLKWGTPYDNSQDMKLHDNATRLTTNSFDIISIEPDGKEMTYDIEVSGPYHNFSANWMIVHNSVNEYSGRYSVMLQEFYIPEIQNIQPQSKDNKQGRDTSFDIEKAKQIQNILNEHSENSWKIYETLIDETTDLARELSRMVLPVNFYTKFVWKMDLHNLMHFIKLRIDSHAQYEIRVFADAIYNIAKEKFPLAIEAFEDYVLHGKHFSRMEIILLENLIKNKSDIYTFNHNELDLSIREIKEFCEKIGLEYYKSDDGLYNIKL